LKVNNIVFTEEPIIVTPIHCPLKFMGDYTHHSIIPLILSDFDKSLVIEITGVKGKTSTVAMLTSIFSKMNVLVLSSLGAMVFNDDKKIMLKENISITPASVLETINLANDYNYDYCLFESSLGGSGLADIGLVTNIVEDYPIARNNRSASFAKAQMFSSSLTCCEFNSYITYYKNNKNINLFSFEAKTENNIKSNLYLKDYKIELDKSTLEIETNNLKTISGKKINKTFTIETFAPSKYQIYNVLACVCVALSSDISLNQIKEGLINYKGIKGRSSIKVKDNVNIIEEINPGLNITAIKKAIFMGLNLDNPGIILGGEYGITCEEINEEKLSKTIDNIASTNPNINIILTDKLGLGIKKYSKQNFTYIESPQDSIDFAINNQISNIIFIYRSNYSNLKKR
jgi:UDP-N-acetylmuramyl pentapeptide synthase